MTKEERTASRNKKVRDLFNKVSSKNPKWKPEYVIKDVALTFFLSERTVEAILRYEGKTYSL